jgi:hypothetical protein
LNQVNIKIKKEDKLHCIFKEERKKNVNENTKKTLPEISIAVRCWWQAKQDSS